MFSERLQILIDADQRARLESEAAARGASVASLIREAIDVAFPTTSGHRRAAADRLLGAEAMAVSDVGDLLRELDDVRSRRA